MKSWNGVCHRCGEKSFSFIGSMFNDELLCTKCEDKEKAHPKYEAAREAENAAVKAGNYNFPGIGKPEDL